MLYKYIQLDGGLELPPHSRRARSRVEIGSYSTRKCITPWWKATCSAQAHDVPRHSPNRGAREPPPQMNHCHFPLLENVVGMSRFVQGLPGYSLFSKKGCNW